jgi:hypothetical protein
MAVEMQMWLELQTQVGAAVETRRFHQVRQAALVS